MAKHTSRAGLTRSACLQNEDSEDEDGQGSLENLISAMRLHLLSPTPLDDQTQPIDRHGSVRELGSVPRFEVDSYLTDGILNGSERSMGPREEQDSFMNDRRVPFSEIRNAYPRLTSPFYANLHQKYPHIFKKKVGSDLDQVYQNGDAFLKAKQGQGLKQMIQGQGQGQSRVQGQAIKEIVLGQGQGHYQGIQSITHDMENQHTNQPSGPYHELSNRPASPYRRSEELQAQLTQILYRKDKPVSRTSEPPTLKDRMRQNREAVRQSREPTALSLRRKSCDPSALRSKSCGPSSIKDRLEHNRETMKKLTQNSPFVKSQSNSLENENWDIFADSEPMSSRLTMQGQSRKSLPDSMNHYVYKQFSSNQKRANIQNQRSLGSRTSNTGSSRSSVFNAGQTIPIRRSDRPGSYRDIDSDSAMDSDSIHSLDGAAGMEDEILLQMLCNDLVKSTSGAGQFQRDSDVDSGITNGATDNQESTSSNDSDILNRAMYQPPRPSSVPVGGQHLRPSSRQPFKMLKTGPMKADHTIQPITLAGCISNRADDLDTEVAYFNAHRDETCFQEKENLFKPCVKTVSNRKRNSPTNNLRVRFEDECHQSQDGAAVKKARNDNGPDNLEGSSPAEDESSSESQTDLELFEEYEHGHRTHRASVVIVLENDGDHDNVGQTDSKSNKGDSAACELKSKNRSKKTSSDIESMLVSTQSRNLHSGLDVTVSAQLHLQGNDGDCESETDSLASTTDNSRPKSRNNDTPKSCKKPEQKSRRPSTPVKSFDGVEQGKSQELSSDNLSNQKPQSSVKISAGLKKSNSVNNECAKTNGAGKARCASPSSSSKGAFRSSSCGPVIAKHHSQGSLQERNTAKPKFNSEGHLRKPFDSETERPSRDQSDEEDIIATDFDAADCLSPDRRTTCFGSNLQSSKNLSGSRTSLSEKMDNFKSKAKTRFNTLRRAVSLESLDRKSRSGSVDFGVPAKESSGMKKAPSLSSLFKFGSAKKRKEKSSSRPSTPAMTWGPSKPTNSTRGNTPVRQARSVTPDPTSPPTTSCLPVSGSKLGRALKMRSHSLSDVASLQVEDLRHFRPIGKLVSLNMDGSQTILLNKPAHGPFGFYIARGTSKYKHGIFISRLTDAYPERFFAGLVGIGDEILEINSIKTRNMSLDDVYDVMASRETLLLKIIPLMSRKDI